MADTSITRPSAETIHRATALASEARSHANISQIGHGARSLLRDLAEVIDRLVEERRSTSA